MHRKHEKTAARILRLLLAGPATVEASSTSNTILLRNEKGAVPVGVALLAEMASSGSLIRSGNLVIAAGAGHRTALHSAQDGECRRQHREIGQIMLDDGQGPIVAEINLAELPLAQLMRRKGKDGGAFLTRIEFEAGERLRSDYTRAGIMPRLGVDWERSGAGRQRGEAGGIAEMTDAVLASRQRVDLALRSVGPELSGILIDVCCFLKGLETVERERCWPARSAKMMLKAALGVLARHYHPQNGPRARTLHWGAEGYRPELS